jgi:hypothetical protein
MFLQVDKMLGGKDTHNNVHNTNILYLQDAQVFTKDFIYMISFDTITLSGKKGILSVFNYFARDIVAKRHGTE